MGRVKSKTGFWNSRTISTIFMISFLLVMIIILASNRFMNISVGNEAEAQRNRLELRMLGESLANASDYLTDEVRKYAVTGDIEHLYNYWDDVESKKTRDIIIDTLKSQNPPEVEKAFLEEAKSFSDILITTETISMKLMLIASEVDETTYEDEKTRSYINEVMQYPLPEEYNDLLTYDDMRYKAIEILFDDEYMRYKNLIMTPIENFQEEMNQRLDMEVTESTKERTTASTIQVMSSLAALMLIGIMITMVNEFYLKPLKIYTDDLRGVGRTKEINMTEIRVAPKGVYELKEFGRRFNKMTVVLQKELENRKQAEERMREARDEADKSNNAKSDFLARMSHELRTPLNAIIGYLYLLQQSNIDSQQEEYCDKINYSSESLLGLISDILDFSKIESGNMVFESVDFSIASVIKEVCGVMENNIRQKKLRFDIDIDGEIPAQVKGDPVKLKQVLINLLGNALKFTEKGGVSLSAKLAGMIDGKYTIKFSVEDTGIGIRDEDREKILKPFVQSDAGITRKYGGTGLGLSICSLIISEASQGSHSLEFESEVGKGSRFYFDIDFEKGKKIPQKPDKILLTSMSNAVGKTVLIVDDNEINLAMESEIVEQFGVKTEIAQSGEEAIQKASNSHFDMILMDIRMPDMDGYEAVQKIRAIDEYKRVPIIALTADVVVSAAQKALNSGMNDYIEKPLKPQKLYSLMEKYFDIAINNPDSLITEEDSVFSAKECLSNLNGNEKLLCRIIGKFLQSQKNSAKFVAQH